jgi:transposase
VEAGDSCRAVAALFGVSVASVVKWSQRKRRTGSAAARPMGGKRPYAVAGERDWLLARVAETPDVTLRALVAELAERGITVSYFAVWHFFENEGVTFKKKVCAPVNKIVLTSHGGGGAGRPIRVSSIRRVWSSSMRPGPTFGPGPARCGDCSTSMMVPIAPGSTASGVIRNRKRADL